MISDNEQIARALFSPRMIYNGELQTEAFQLRATISEEYLSVVRMAIESWLDDIQMIPQRKNRQLFGYAQMAVSDVRALHFGHVEYEVKECDNQQMRSHAGIWISYDGEQIVGGKRIKAISDDASQDFILLLIQRRLVELARKGLHIL